MQMQPAQMQPAQAQQAPARWAEGFDAKGKSRAVDGAWGTEFGRQQSASPAQQQPQAAPWQRGPAFAEPRYMGNMGMPMMPQPMPMYQPQPVFQQAPPLMHPAPQKAVPLPPTQAPQEPQQQQEQPRQGPQPQDELARTAQALVDQLDKEELGQNQKLAESQFVRLLRGLGDGSVVVQEGSSAAKEGTEVGDGAKFVDANGGGDWASAFLDSGSAPQTTQQPATSTGEFQVHTGARDTARPFADFQTALTMNDGGMMFNGSMGQRRKSVHFDEPAVVSGVPSTLEEAQNMTATSVPGAQTSWEEDLSDDFNDEAFMQYNGRMPQVAEQTGQTTSDREGWDELTAPWYAEAYAQETQSQPYLFHQANPYAMGAPIVRELSPTTMVSASPPGGGREAMLSPPTSPRY
jgi:peroxin-5